MRALCAKICIDERCTTNYERTMKLFIALALLLPTLSYAATPDLLTTIQQRGILHCGVNQFIPGYGQMTKNGSFEGYDIDVCHAVAIAIFGDPNKVKFVVVNGTQRFTALQSGAIDVLSRNTTWTASRDGTIGVDFTTITSYDGQSVMVRKDLGVAQVDQLKGATLCAKAGSTTEKNISDYFRQRSWPFTLITYEDLGGLLVGLRAKRCDAITTDRSQLYAARLSEKDPGAFVILDELIAKEPLGPVVTANNSRLRDVVTWTIFALVNAEELGLTQANVKQQRATSQDPRVQRLLGVTGNIGQGFGLRNDFAFHLIRHLGNFGEIYDRHLGANSRFKIPRAHNSLWSDGGLLYAPPYR